MSSGGTLLAASFGEPSGQGWEQVGELLLAFVLSALIGLERQARQKSAGLRTHTLVGVGAALIVIVSKYGFSDVLISGRIVLDPSRVAAQIVSGLGFIGGGLIFVRRDSVRGLTTAAVVWVTAAIGMAAGAGLPILAVLVTVLHFLTVYVFGPWAHRITGSPEATARLTLTYRGGTGALRTTLAEFTSRGYRVIGTRIEAGGFSGDGHDPDSEVVRVMVTVDGPPGVADLLPGLSERTGVISASLDDEEATD